MATALILSDSKPGHENQSKALAEGLGFSYRIVPCVYPSKFRKTLSYLCDHLPIRPDCAGVFNAAEAAFAKDHPAILIGAGSNTFYSLKYLRARFNVPAVAILTPKGYRLSGFDAILAPAFDCPPMLPNVFTIPTNLTPARPDFYEAQTRAFLDRYTPLKPSAVGVIVGGKNAIADVSPAWLEKQLTRIFDATPDCEHWVTTSRRTSPEAEAVLERFPFDYKLLFSKDHFNPIPAFVTRCERLFVTAESTGMLSEAVAVGTSAVEVLDNLDAKRAGKFGRFVNNLCAEGYAHRFDGSLGDARRKVDLAPIFGQVSTMLKLKPSAVGR